MKKIRFKQAAAVAMAGVMAASLAGCMPTENSKATEGTTAAAAQTESAGNGEPAEAEGLSVNTTDPITLRMNWWGGDSRHQATLEAIKAFEAKYPNIKVEAEYESLQAMRRRWHCL